MPCAHLPHPQSLPPGAVGLASAQLQAPTTAGCPTCRRPAARRYAANGGALHTLDLRQLSGPAASLALSQEEVGCLAVNRAGSFLAAGEPSEAPAPSEPGCRHGWLLRTAGGARQALAAQLLALAWLSLARPSPGLPAAVARSISGCWRRRRRWAGARGGPGGGKAGQDAQAGAQQHLQRRVLQGAPPARAAHRRHGLQVGSGGPLARRLGVAGYQKRGGGGLAVEGGGLGDGSAARPFCRRPPPPPIPPVLPHPPSGALTGPADCRLAGAAPARWRRAG
jgi:hypothetical protein